MLLEDLSKRQFVITHSVLGSNVTTPVDVDSSMFISTRWLHKVVVLAPIITL